MGPFGSDLELAELLMRTLCDADPSAPTDIAYLFGNTADNQDSVLCRGADLFERKSASKIGICDFRRCAGYEGTAIWRDALVSAGVPLAHIVEIPGAHPISHTHTETEHLMARTHDEGWHNILIVTTPFHQLRAFMDTIGTLIRDGLDRTIRVWNATGISQPWTDEVVHSQGVLRARRFELVKPELERIVRYWEKGDMPTARQVLDYLNWRDGLS